ncbi:telomerase protein component 1-like [Rhinophrynus dorsalis]
MAVVVGEQSALDVAQMWNVIDSWPSEKPPNPITSVVPRGWQTVRVFVSSTFDDFHSERELLIKQVFPELREWCEAHSLCLVECDLRWGIPQDTPSHKILTTCLGELDRCQQDTYGKALMVILLGERVGWVPNISQVPQEVIEQYHWVTGMSVTGMEILHGAYRNCNPNAAFCLRDPSFLGQLPVQEVSRYQEKGWKALLLQTMKKHVCQRFPAEQIMRYQCQVLGTDSVTGAEKVKLGFSEDFSSWILRFLKTRILDTFPRNSEALTALEGPSWDQSEVFQHQLFLQQRCQLFLGRELEIQSIMEFLQVDLTDPNQQLTFWENKGSKEELKNPRVPIFQITAESGMGKSSLISVCISKALELPQTTVFYHFIGCCPSSVKLCNLVMRLCCHLMPPGSEREDVLLRIKDCGRNEEMKEIMKQLLASAPLPAGTTLCVFIDAVNQLSNPHDVSDLLSWMGTVGFIPFSCRCVFSSTSKSSSFTEVSPYYLHLELLSSESARSLAVIYLSRYSKTLSPEQLHLLLHNTSSLNPLWLSLACEELRVFGVFETLTQKIIGFPNTLQGLLGNIIERLVQEDPADRVRKLLCLMHCCPGGMAERDLQGALSELEGVSEIPPLHWATLRRTLYCLLRVGQDLQARDTLNFFHGSITKAVEQCLLVPEGSQQPYLISLANYYEYRCPDNATVVIHLPQLLQEARLNERLVNFLRKDSRSLSIPAPMRAQYLKTLRCSQICRDGFPRSPALICLFCSLRTGAFGQLFPNRQSCVVCGSLVSTMISEAFLCFWHSRPARTECVVCKSPILGPNDPIPALLCHICGFTKTCITLKI